MIQEAHEVIKDQIRKFKGAYRTPEQIDRALYRGILDYYNTLFKSKNNAQQVHRYIIEQEYNISGVNLQDLPEDFKEEIGIFSMFESKKWEGEILTEAEFSDRANSYIMPPDEKNPIARLFNGKIEILPNQGNFKLTYYRFPFKPLYNYDVIDERRIVYNPLGSVDLDIDGAALNIVVSNALSYLGIALNDQSIMLDKQVNGN